MTHVGSVRVGRNIIFRGYQENQVQQEKDQYIFIYNLRIINHVILVNKMLFISIIIKE
jgi:hypothetical protein